jgi:hypothetical protein
MLHIRSFVLVLAGLSTLCSAPAVTITEDFSSDPLQNGWQIFGDTNQFQWDSTNQNLQVTWDSSQSNSYFYYSIGTILARADDFSLAFDLRVNDIGPGPDTNKSSSFEIALGFLNLNKATETNFVRGTGFNSPDLAELTYFWDSGFGATTWPLFVDTNSTFNWNGSSDYAVFALTNGVWYHISLTYTASNQTAIATVTNFQQTSGVLITQTMNLTNFGDFRVDTLSINSYTDAGQDPQYAGSVLAHGVVDNLVATVPPPPVQNLGGTFTNGAWQVQFNARSNWLYTLQRTTDFQSWTNVSSITPGGGSINLSDPDAVMANAFYRVRADRP